jgi:hypothetical protein
VLADCAWHLRKSGLDALAYARRGCTLLLTTCNAEANEDFARLVDLAPEAETYLALVLECLKSREVDQGDSNETDPKQSSNETLTH